MALRFVFNAVLLNRNGSSPQMNCLLKKKIINWKEFKLFHISTVSLDRNLEKVDNKEVPKKNKTLDNARKVKLWKNMKVADIAKAMNITLRDLGLHVPQLNLKPDSVIEDFSIFYPIAEKLNMRIHFVNNPNEGLEKKSKLKWDLRQEPSKPENLVKRPPVVTIMGHVDHGKTTLLDSLRNTFVAQQEFGGITQHIGAFSVEVKPGERITFIDTPGHAAFTSMRSRGADVTDIVVLVIAADDGVMEQTVESIRIIRAAQVRVIIAVNKIDKAKAATIDEIKESLLLEGIQVEEKGGNIQLVPISALKKINLDLLSEIILLEAEELNLKGDPTGFVEGVVIESKKEKMGIVATIIVKRGTLRKAKIVIAGKTYCKVRRMLDENGEDYKEALPSTPVQIFGWKELPSAGDKVFEVKCEKEASRIVQERIKNSLVEKQEAQKEIIQKKTEEQVKKLHDFKSKILELKTIKERRKFFFETTQSELKKSQEADTTPHLKVILKGDVYGTVEVLLKILQSYDKDDECKLSVIDASVGDIKQTDLTIAEYFQALIYAFNVKVHEAAKEYAKEKNVDIRFYNVIYKLIDDLKNELTIRMPPKDEEKINGEAEVLENFMITYGSKKTPVAGARCIKGELNKDSLYRVVRKNEIIYEGKLLVMKNQKKIVKTILKGTECGLLFDSFSDKFIPGDKIICYDLVKVSKATTWDPGF